MPSPLTSKRTSKRDGSTSAPVESRPVDLGTPLGPYDTNSVRDRVRQWQAQGGGVITASDIYVEADSEDDGQERRAAKAERHTPLKENRDHSDGEDSRSNPRQSGRQRKKAALGERDPSRSVSAPRKRVVSDAHWRRDRRSSKGGTAPNSKEKPVLKDPLAEDGIRIRPIKERRGNLNSKAEEKSRERSAGNDDGIRVYATPPGSRRHSACAETPEPVDLEVEDEKSDDGRYISEERSESYEEPTTARRRREAPLETSRKLDSPASKSESKNRRSDQRKERSPNIYPRSIPATSEDNRKSHRLQKGNILTQVPGELKKIFARAEPIIVPSPRIPSVEAWLSETPDPFVDGEEIPVEIPAPLKSKPRETTEKIIEPVPKDPNIIWESIGEADSSRNRTKDDRRRSQNRSPTKPDRSVHTDSSSKSIDDDSMNNPRSASQADLAHEVPDLSPSSLRRRGANRNSPSPTKERRKSSPLKECFTADEDVSVVFSNESTSSVEPYDPSMPLFPPGLRIRRPFPSTGAHKLSTIASVETFSSIASKPITELSQIAETIRPSSLPTNNGDDYRSEVRDQFDSDALDRRPSKSRLTKHADLISILSLPRAGSKSIQSARSIRTNRSRLATATLTDLMKEVTTDEIKYMRELRTLVHGVIPVLLSCVLSKSDSAVAAGLFSPNAPSATDPNITKPIMDMGIALERLKTLHKRIPTQDTDALLSWAQGASRVYSEYLKAWRMGFQDVVVNLAPATNDPNLPAAPETDELEQGLPRNEHGDVINSDGERVDVAFLLKRPLVRLKYLAKTFKGINFIKPSAEAEALAAKYQDLVIRARQRSNEERARLEDQAAASIDPIRARDIHTLAPLTGVRIDHTRRVRARDYFNLTLQHTSGQRIDCRVELLLRDDAPGNGSSGDLLLCEVDGSGRWLLLPPIPFGRLSARNGDLEGEIVVMIRSPQSNGGEWHELLSLQTEEEQAGFEWVQMLGLTPVPPTIVRTHSFLQRQVKRKSLPAIPTANPERPPSPKTPVQDRTPGPREVEVPIGEPARDTIKALDEPPVKNQTLDLPTPPLKARSRLQKRAPLKDDKLPAIPPPEVDHAAYPGQRASNLPDSPSVTRSPRSLNEALKLAGGLGSGLNRAKAHRNSRHADSVSSGPQSPSLLSDESEVQRPSLESYQPPRPSSDYYHTDHQSPVLQPENMKRSGSPEPLRQEPARPPRPSARRSKSSVPSLDLPIIPKVRKDSPPTTPTYEIAEEPEWPSLNIEKDASSPRKVPAKWQKNKPREPAVPVTDESPPAPPIHGSVGNVQVGGTKTPDLRSPCAGLKRRSSSPLKHEYEPSTASESSSDSDASTVERHEVSSASESPDSEDLEDGDVPTPLLPLGALQRPKVSPPRSLYSIPNGTIAPSQSASQAPYKTVPAQPHKAMKAIASIFYWSEKGLWQPVHPDECSVTVTPGLIEAFEMSAAHSRVDNLRSSSNEPDIKSEISLQSSSQASDASALRPIIALELTPLVPIRRGTALDISIRSPPTAESKVTSIPGNNVMFRSRNPEECEALYALINYSRINNPTYIALQNARVTSSFAPAFDRSNSTKGSSSRSSSWFGFGYGGGRSSYRASSAPTPSIAISDSSVSSMKSAFSALKRFGLGGGGGSRFSISRSTVTSRTGSRANSIYTASDDQSSGSGTSSPIVAPILAGVANANGAPIGINNAKIRLYARETASKWRDLGSARLTIMRPTNASHPPLMPGVSSAGKANAGGGGAPATAHYSAGGGVTAAVGPLNVHDKRVVVIGKVKSKVLLDVTLGESCFERIGRTGIALSVWEAFEGGGAAKEGGVVGGRLRVFMIQVSFSAFFFVSSFFFSFKSYFFLYVGMSTGGASHETGVYLRLSRRENGEEQFH